jgi:hypothetical protein
MTSYSTVFVEYSGHGRVVKGKGWRLPRCFKFASGRSCRGSAASARRPAEDHVPQYVAVGGPSRRDDTTLGGVAPRQPNLSQP